MQKSHKSSHPAHPGNAALGHNNPQPKKRFKGYSPDQIAAMGPEDGPSDDSWINRGYWNMSKPNPNYRGKPGGS